MEQLKAIGPVHVGLLVAKTLCVKLLVAKDPVCGAIGS